MQPTIATRDKILYFCHKKSRPLFIGELASDIGWSIERTESYVEFMINEGVMRNATPEEIKILGGLKDSHACTIVGKTNPKLSHLP